MSLVLPQRFGLFVGEASHCCGLDPVDHFGCGPSCIAQEQRFSMPMQINKNRLVNHALVQFLVKCMNEHEHHHVHLGSWGSNPTKRNSFMILRKNIIVDKTNLKNNSSWSSVGLVYL